MSNEHDLYEHDELAHCKICGGAEESLPTLCPGRRMTEAEEKAVYAAELNFTHGPMTGAGWWVSIDRSPWPNREAKFHAALAKLIGKRDQGRVMGAYREVHAAAPWDENAERKAFEDACYAHYLRVREERAAKGQRIAYDTADQPRPQDALFEKYQNGEYVSIAYQQAWGGWKLARGGL